MHNALALALARALTPSARCYSLVGFFFVFALVRRFPFQFSLNAYETIWYVYLFLTHSISECRCVRVQRVPLPWLCVLNVLRELLHCSHFRLIRFCLFFFLLFFCLFGFYRLWAHTHNWCRRSHRRRRCRRHFNWLDEFIITVILQKFSRLIFCGFCSHEFGSWCCCLYMHCTVMVGVSYTFFSLFLIISMTIYRHVCFSELCVLAHFIRSTFSFHCLWKPFVKLMCCFVAAVAAVAATLSKLSGLNFKCKCKCKHEFNYVRPQWTKTKLKHF